MSQGDEEYKVQQNKLQEALRQKNEKLENGSSDASVQGAEKTEVKRSLLYDRNTRILNRILETDFRNQDWIEKPEAMRKTRKNIDENYRLVTGQGGLGSKELKERKEAFEKRRLLSSKASEQIARLITRGFEIKESIVQLTADIRGLDVKDFSFKSDEELVEKFAANMPKLIKAEELLRRLDAGEDGEFAEDSEIYRKLLWMKDVKAAWEERMIIISSPYYVSVKEEDFTEETVEHLKNNWKTGVDVAPEYVDAVIAWQKRKSDEHAFKQGVEGMDETGIDRLARSHRENLDMLEAQNGAFIFMEKYDKKVREKAEESGFKHDVSTYSLAEIYDHMKGDTESKSQSYYRMERALADVFRMKHGVGEFGTTKAGNRLADYRDIIRYAETTAFEYASSHTKWFHFTKSGDERYKMSVRLGELLRDLRRDMNTVIENEIVNPGIEKNEEQSLDIDTIINTGAFTAEEAGKEMKGWLLDNPEYKAVLSRIVKGKEDLQGDKEILLKFLEDKNRLLVANNITLSMICEEHPELTMKLPALKQELKRYINERSEENPKAQEMIFSEVNEFRRFIEDCLKDFKKNNKDDLDTIRLRRDAFLNATHANEKDALLWERPEMEELLLSDLTEQEFNARIKAFIENKKGNEEIIDRLISEMKWSKTCREALAQKIREKLGSSLFFSGELDVADRVGQLITAVDYFAPMEAEAERRLESAMFVYEMDPSFKDSLAGFLSGGAGAEGIVRIEYEQLMKKTEVFADRIVFCRALFTTGNVSRMKLTAAQWEDLEKLGKDCGSRNKEEILSEFNGIVKNAAPGSKISRDAYKTGKGKVRRTRKSVGFSEGILGDRFLAADDVKSLLEEDEISYLSENLVQQFSEDDISYAKLERATGADIAAIVGIMKKNLKENHKRLRSLKEDKGIDTTVKRRVLLRTICASGDGDEGAFERILKEESEEFAKKTAVTKEIKEVRELIEEGIPKDEHTSLRAAVYKKRLNYLKSYDRGSYALLAPFLMKTPEFYEKVMNLTRKEFRSFVKVELEDRFGTVAAALKASSVGDVTRSLYLEEHFKDIYSGKLSGNAVFFKKDISAFERRLFEEKGSDGKTMQDNFNEAVWDIEKKLEGTKAEKLRKAAVVKGVGGLVLSRILNNKDDFEILKSKKRLRDEIEKLIPLYEINAAYAQQNFILRFDSPDCPFFDADDKEKTGLIRMFGEFVRERLIENKPENFKKLFPRFVEEFEKRQTAVREETGRIKLPDNYNEVRREVEERKDSYKALLKRREFLGYSDTVKDMLQVVYTEKALVNVNTENTIDLSHRSRQVARDHLKERLSYLGEDLSPFIVDCLVEKNVTEWYDEAIDRTPGVHWVVRKITKGFSTLEEHAKWLVDARVILKDADKGEEPVSEDELNMMIVNIYRHEGRFKKKDESGEHDHSRSVIKGRWYKTFRENYKLLKEFEGMKVKSPALRQEQFSLSRDLRAFLSTGLQIKDQDKRAACDFKTRVLRAKKYVSRVQELCSLLGERLDASQDFSGLEPSLKTAHIEALRAYFNTELIDELSAEKEETAFNAEAWKTRIDTVLSDGLRMRYMLHCEMAVGNESLNKQNRNYAAVTGRGAVDSVIEKYAWPGQRKKYRELSDEGKEFFCLALMLMEKTALGLEGGTARVLGCRELEEEQAGSRLLELKKYLNGEDYDLKVDYTMACYKLVNYGYDYSESRDIRLSDTAYDKAFEFAEGIIKRRYSLDKKDIEKAGDPRAVIIEAGMLGKEQSGEMMRISNENWTIGKFKAKLSEYAVKDMQKLQKKIGISEYIPFKQGQAKKELERISAVSLKIAKLGKLDLCRLVGVLQNRTALDLSTKDKDSVINEDAREELKLMLSDESESSLADFTSSGACMKAILSAISFKIKDDKKQGGDMYEKSDFDNVSFDREGMADWELLERALDLLEESKKDNIARFAVRHASDYVEFSGNEKAVAEYKRFKQSSNMDEAGLTAFLRQQAEQDADSGENAEARIAFGGFMALSQKQKNLFFRVLEQRDLLDISKRNLYRNIFKGSAERTYANEVGRFRLIDEFIEKSRGGNEGITLSETAHFDAFRSLLSTQVDDTSDFESIQDVRKALAGERLYVFQRKTAVDWKLFTRALQFVNRASYELEISEGNAELYRSAGNLSKYGHMSMDYSVLRRNIHNTGNQFLRFGVQRGLEFAGPNILKGIKFDIFGFQITAGDLADFITDAAMLVMPESAAGAIKEVRDELLEGKTERAGKKAGIYQFNPGNTNEKAEKDLKKKMSSSFNDIDRMSVQIDAIFADAKLMEKNASDIGALIDHMIPAPSFKSAQSETEKSGKKEDVLETQIRGYKEEKRYGDIRDTISRVGKIYGEGKKIYGVAKRVPYVSDRVRDVIKLTEVKIIESFSRAAAGSEKMSWVNSALKDSYSLIKADKLEKLKKDTLEKLIKEGKVPKDYEFTEHDIRDHVYWSEKDEELNDTEKLKAADNAAKTYLSGVIEGLVGKENAKDIYEAVVDVREFTGSLRKGMVWAGAAVNLAKGYIQSFEDIAKRAENLKLISDADERAEKQEVKDRDKEKLSKAAAHQTEDQKKLTEWTAEHHLDLEKMAGEVAETIQSIEITRDVMNAAIQTGVVIAHAAGADPVTSKIVGEAVRAGVDLALYAIRVVKDQNMLADYYRNTTQGKGDVSAILEGARSAFGKEKVDDDKAVKDDRVLDIICAGKGYEMREELVTDSGLKIASSIAFGASDFNPLLSNKIRAVTCMSVLGLKDRIGKTDSDTVFAIFNAMKAA